jgi:hypothetical protein
MTTHPDDADETGQPVDDRDTVPADEAGKESDALGDRPYTEGTVQEDYADPIPGDEGAE